MATAFVTSRSASAMSFRPRLPVIEHPNARKGDASTLSVRGSSRGSLFSPNGLGTRTQTFVTVGNDGDAQLGLDKSNLPPLRKNDEHGDDVTDDLKYRHTRLLTWPPVHTQNGDRAKTAKGNNLDIVPRNRYGPQELYEMVKERLTTGYYGLLHLFKSNDPKGQGIVSRCALPRILFHLCGYLTPDQLQILLYRIGLDKKEMISFDDFIGQFRDNEVIIFGDWNLNLPGKQTAVVWDKMHYNNYNHNRHVCHWTVQREWLSPVAKKQLSCDKSKLHPENYLRDKSRAPAETQSQYSTAAFAHAFLRQRVLEGGFNIRHHLPEICFEPNGVIVSPQLKECISSVGLQLEDDQFSKLWQRYDLECVGAIPASYFFTQIGLDKHGRPHVTINALTPRPGRTFPKTSWVPNIPDSEETEKSKVEEESQEEIVIERQTPSLDIISYLTRRMEFNFHALRMGFEHFDHTGVGVVSKMDFHNVMNEYDFKMTRHECNRLIERCSVTTSDGNVNYKEFLLKFMSRSERDLAHRVISDPCHKFNTRAFTPPGALSIQDVEAKLVEYFHKEFLQLLGSLRKLDKFKLELVTQKQLRDTVDRIFNTKMTDGQFKDMLNEIGLEQDGLVDYSKLMALFNKKRPWSLHGVSTPIATPKPKLFLERPHTVASGELLQGRDWNEKMENKAQQTEPITPPEFKKMWEKEAKKAGIFEEEDKTYPLRVRPLAMLEDAVEDILRHHFHTAQKCYHKIDRKGVGRISKPQFHKWLQEIGIILNMQELDEMWSSLAVSRDGIVHFSEIYGHFTQRHIGPPPIEGKLLIEDASTMLEQMKKVQQAQKERVKELQKQTHKSKTMKTAMKNDFILPSDDLIEKLRQHVVMNWSELKKLFRQLDRHGIATIKQSQMKNILQSLRFPLTSEEMENLCQRFDFTSSGLFHYMQFMELYTVNGQISPYDKQADKIPTPGFVMTKMRKKVIPEWKSLRRAFKKVDRKNDGFVTITEFKQVLKENKCAISEEDLYHLSSQLDSSLDGNISYDEFINAMCD